MGMISHGLHRENSGGSGLKSLRIRNLRPAYLESVESSEVYAKPDLILDCRACLSFMASSGRGKTTFVRSLLGLPVPGGGSIDFITGPGESAHSQDPGAFVRACHISVIPQDFKLIGHVSVWTNIRLAQSAWKIPFPGSTLMLPDDEEILRMACVLEMESRLDRKVQSLSRGEQQRAAILRALSRPFDLLLADEPFSHLDGSRDEKALALILETVQKYQAGLWILDLGFVPGLESLKSHGTATIPAFKEYHL